MPKEQDLRDEILKASPLLNAFIAYNSSRSGKRLTDLADVAIDKMEQLRGPAKVASVVAGYKAILEVSGLLSDPFDGESPEDLEQKRLGQTAMIVALGFEIGRNTKNAKIFNKLGEEIARKAIELDIIVPDGGNESAATSVIKATLRAGFQMSH